MGKIIKIINIVISSFELFSQVFNCSDATSSYPTLFPSLIVSNVNDKSSLNLDN